MISRDPMIDDDDEYQDLPDDREEPRFLVSQDGLGKWEIMDTYASARALTNGRELTGLDYIDARDIADLLNRDHGALLR